MARVMTITELATYLKCHPTTIYRQIQRGKLPAFKVGRDWRFDQESVDRWIRELERANKPCQGHQPVSETNTVSR